MRPLVFIIVNYNTADLALRLVENIKEYKSVDKIIIVDNCSVNNDYQKLKQIGSEKIEVLKTDSNKGFSYGMNVGAKKALSIYPVCDFIFSNTDIIIHSDENIFCLKTLLHKRNVGLLGPVICQKDTLSRGWKIPSPNQEILINLPLIGRKFHSKFQNYKDNYYQKELTFVDAVSGCFFLMKSEALKAISFFDEDVFLYYEENITGKKLSQKGYKVALANEVVVLHDHSISIDRSMNAINKFKMLKKSQYYFEENYNRAPNVQLFFLKLTSSTKLLTL